MLTKRIYSIAAILALLMLVSVSNATNLRGRVDGKNQYSESPYPLSGTTVDLFIQSSGAWKSIARYTTGANGMYFFKGVAPGSYVLQINGKRNYPITVVEKPNQDLPLIIIQF